MRDIPSRKSPDSPAPATSNGRIELQNPSNPDPTMARYPRGILVSCEIPWDDRERLLEGVFRQEIQSLQSAGFSNLYVFGTAGEGYAVANDAFKHIVEVFCDELEEAKAKPMVGVIGLSTATIVERIAFAHELGVGAFQISLPSWGALNDREVETFFRDVCGAFPAAQFLHYNLPRVKRLLTGRDYRRLADRVPNLVATKNTGGGLHRAADLMSQAPDLQHFFGEENFPHGCHYGECSLLASLAALEPAATHALFRAGCDQDGAALFQWQHYFHDLLHGVFGDLLAQARIDGAYDKLIVRLGGQPMPLRLLSPYEGFTAEHEETCRARLERFRGLSEGKLRFEQIAKS